MKCFHLVYISHDTASKDFGIKKKKLTIHRKYSWRFIRKSLYFYHMTLFFSISKIITFQKNGFIHKYDELCAVQEKSVFVLLVNEFCLSIFVSDKKVRIVYMWPLAQLFLVSSCFYRKCVYYTMETRKTLFFNQSDRGNSYKRIFLRKTDQHNIYHSRLVLVSWALWNNWTQSKS